jgi:DNA recombination protein RmuC
MEFFLFIVILIVIALGFWIIFQTLKKQSEKKPDDQSLLLLQNQIQDQQKHLQIQMNELTRTMDAKLGESSKAIRDQFGESAKIVKEITQELMKVGEGQKQMANVANDLKNLQDILKNPKQRGVLGEYYLETVLKNVLPPGVYKMQYEFKDGTIVDAAVITKEGVIPIDSKFSLENYNRFLEASDKTERERYETAFYNDLKLRIDETAKYVKPEEGTLDFAFMFIPSEAVYYDLLINKIGTMKSTNVDLIEYAAGKKKVIVVSPTTFLAYLQTVMQGLKALHIEEAAKKIGTRVEELGKHIKNYQEYMDRLGKNLGATVSAYNAGGKEFKKIDKDIYRITGEELSLEAPVLEKPEENDGDEKLL